MNHKTVSIHHFEGTASGNKAKTALSFFDIVLHFTLPTIELEHLIRSYFHCSDNERIQVEHLPARFLNLEDNSTGLPPGSCLVQECAVFGSVIHLIVFRCVVQCLVFLLSQFAENSMFIQADGILYLQSFSSRTSYRFMEAKPHSHLQNRHRWMSFSIHLKDENSNKLKHSNYVGLIQSLNCYSMNNSGLILFYSSSPSHFPSANFAASCTHAINSSSICSSRSIMIW